MGLKGAAIGGCIGSLFGGPFGALFGAVAGHQIENRILAGRMSSGRKARVRAEPSDDPYRVLGARPSDSDEELRMKYRKLAKSNHPDRIGTSGGNESEKSRANDRMIRINNAWNAIKRERGL